MAAKSLEQLSRTDRIAATRITPLFLRRPTSCYCFQPPLCLCLFWIYFHFALGLDAPNNSTRQNPVPSELDEYNWHHLVWNLPVNKTSFSNVCLHHCNSLKKRQTSPNCSWTSQSRVYSLASSRAKDKKRTTLYRGSHTIVSKAIENTSKRMWHVLGRIFSLKNQSVSCCTAAVSSFPRSLKIYGYLSEAHFRARSPD